MPYGEIPLYLLQTTVVSALTYRPVESKLKFIRLWPLARVFLSQELRPPSAVGTGLFQMPGFSIPEPQGRGASVRNLTAFSVLQTVFLKGRTDFLCSTVLDAVVSVYHADPVNYFILENQHTLSQLAERVPSLSTEIQGKFFEILSYVVMQLNFVPCKELISLSLLLQQQQSIECR